MISGHLNFGCRKITVNLIGDRWAMAHFNSFSVIVTFLLINKCRKPVKVLENKSGYISNWIQTEGGGAACVHLACYLLKCSGMNSVFLAPFSGEQDDPLSEGTACMSSPPSAFTYSRNLPFMFLSWRPLQYHSNETQGLTLLQNTACGNIFKCW